MRTIIRTATGFVLASLLLQACGGTPAAVPADATSGGPTGLSTVSENVELQPDVAVLELASDEVASVGEGGLSISATAPGAADLRAGQVAVLGPAGPRTITAVRKEGDRLIVDTADAALPDVIRNGKIGWTYGVAWDQIPFDVFENSAESEGLQLAAASVDGQALPASVLAELDRRLTAGAKGLEFKFSGELEGFQVDFELQPKPDKLEFELKATRMNITVIAKGWISNFLQTSEMVFDDGEAEFVRVETHGLKGEAELTWATFQVEDPSLDDDITAFEVPLKLHLPFTVGGLPMTLSISANTRIVPSFKTTGGSSGGSFKFTYTSDHGFSSDGGSVKPVAAVQGFSGDLGSTDTVTAGYGPAGFGFGLEFPRLELSLGWPNAIRRVNGALQLPTEIAGEALALEEFLRPYVFLTLNQYANGMWTPGTTLTSDIPPCQRASLNISAIAGYKWTAFKFLQLSDSTALWEKTIDKFKNGLPCNLTGE